MVAAAATHIGAKTILIVDDDDPARETLCEMLGDAGYRCLQAVDGRDAIEVLSGADQLPCAILLDLMMPGMNGWDFRDWQRAHPTFAKIPVIVLSAAKDAPRLAPEAMLSKPIRFDELLGLVGRYCAS